ncbi:MAG TPA: creatininase family protein [Candidatus Binatia bacterium]|nr:creatininase family protein [Candidatus Binatia bacterium]
MTGAGRSPAVSSFEELTWREAGAATDPSVTVVLPVGSLEQHGHHLPLGTDALLALELARRLGERRPVLILPPLFYAARSQPRSSGAAREFPGSVGLSGAVLTRVCRDLVGDLLQQGFRHILILNGHYENAAFLFEGLTEVAGSGAGARCVLLNWWEQLRVEDVAGLFPDGFPGWEVEHAGVVETSLMEALCPHLVRGDAKTDDPGTRVRSYDVFPLPPDAVPPTGVPWRSTPASAAIGARLATVLVDRIEAVLRLEMEMPDAGGSGGAAPPPVHRPDLGGAAGTRASGG